MAAPGGDPGRRGRGPGRGRGARSGPHLLRARPRPHPALGGLPPAGRQDPGLRLPRRPPAHPADPRPRGGPGGHRHRPGGRAQRGADRGHRPRPRLRPRSGRARQRGRARRRSCPRATTTPSGAPTSSWRRSTCARETLDGIRNHSWSRPRRRTPEGEVVELGRPHRLRVPRLRGRGAGGHRQRRRRCPAEVARALRATRAASSSAPSSARWSACIAGRRASSGWRPSRPRRWPPCAAFNYERIYSRPESVAQSRGRRRGAAGAGRALRGATREPCRPSTGRRSGSRTRCGRRWPMSPGMTDRFAFDTAAARSWTGRPSGCPAGSTSGWQSDLMSEQTSYVVVGGGLAGAKAAEAIRDVRPGRRDHAGRRRGAAAVRAAGPVQGRHRRQEVTGGPVRPRRGLVRRELASTWCSGIGPPDSTASARS